MKQIDVVCAVIKNDENKLFIAKRKSNVANGIWEFPGGKVEADEGFEEACIRECKEELNIDIAIDRFLVDFYDEALPVAVHVFAYAAHIVNGQIEFHAHYEGAWVTPAQLYQFAFQEADRCLLDYLQTLEN